MEIYRFKHEMEPQHGSISVYRHSMAAIQTHWVCRIKSYYSQIIGHRVRNMKNETIIKGKTVYSSQVTPLFLCDKHRYTNKETYS